MYEKEHLLEIFKKVKQSLKNKDVIELKNLSNQTIHDSSVIQNPESISIAVIIYSLSKILERENFREYKGWKKFYNFILLEIDKSIVDIEDNKDLNKDLESIISSINKLSGKLKFYIQHVFRNAKINKASRIYEHGLSMEKTAKLLGISLFELAEYSGRGKISDVSENKTLDIKKRIKLAEEMFND